MSRIEASLVIVDDRYRRYCPPLTYRRIPKRNCFRVRQGRGRGRPLSSGAHPRKIKVSEENPRFLGRHEPRRAHT